MAELADEREKSLKWTRKGEIKSLLRRGAISTRNGDIIAQDQGPFEKRVRRDYAVISVTVGPWINTRLARMASFPTGKIHLRPHPSK